MKPYKSILVIAKLKKNDEGNSLVLNVPFKLYAQNIVMMGKDITYRLHDLSNNGKEVLAKVDYRQTDMEGRDVKDESDLANAFAGNLGSKWADVKGKVEYKKHWAVTKEEALATYDENGTKSLYNGIDKNDPTKFCQWDEEVEEPVV